MRQQIAASMKDHYLNHYRHYDGYRLEEIDIKQRGYEFMGHIKFLFDRTNSDLLITGDYGYAAFSWGSSQNSLEDIRDYVKDSYWYFASKCKASSRNIYVYDRKKAKKDIKRWLDIYELNSIDFDINQYLSHFNNAENLLQRLTSCVDSKQGFNLHLSESWAGENADLEMALDHISGDWILDAGDWGKRPADIIQVWAHALDLGIRWAKQQERE